LKGFGAVNKTFAGVVLRLCLELSLFSSQLNRDFPPALSLSSLPSERGNTRLFFNSNVGLGRLFVSDWFASLLSFTDFKLIGRLFSAGDLFVVIVAVAVAVYRDLYGFAPIELKRFAFDNDDEDKDVLFGSTFAMVG
jgi:hypothetical protein